MNRFASLDAIRGIAALFVVLYHLGEFGIAVAPNGYLAVDFFFALSGFVIAHSYEERLNENLTARRFAKLRLIRLYPLFAVGLVLATAKAAGQVLLGGRHALSTQDLLLSLASEILFLPSLSTPGELYPLNGPAWSLCFEILINIAYALALIRCSTLMLFGVAIVSGGAVIAVCAHAGNLNVGWNWATFHGGLARVFFSFSIGVVFYRIGVGRSKVRSAACLAPITLAVAAMTAPVPASMRVGFDCVVAMLLFPLLLAMAARYEPPREWAPVAMALGELSFPMYATHFPIIFIAGYAASRLAVSPYAFAFGVLALVVVSSWILSRWIDVPVRRELMKRFS
jgi:peptidoglycan/LPS O-acetylase OafA/YrhL